MDTFIQMAKQYFGRFLAQVLLMFSLFVVTMTFMLAFWPLGPVVIIGIFILAFFLIFWDYIIVAENARLIEAAKISLARVKADLREVLLFIIPIVLVTALFSIVANAFIGAGPLLAVLAIALYAYFGTAVVFTIMGFYLEISGRESGTDCTK